MTKFRLPFLFFILMLFISFYPDWILIKYSPVRSGRYHSKIIGVENRNNRLLFHLFTIYAGSTDNCKTASITIGGNWTREGCGSMSGIGATSGQTLTWGLTAGTLSKNSVILAFGGGDGITAVPNPTFTISDNAGCGNTYTAMNTGVFTSGLGPNAARETLFYAISNCAKSSGFQISFAVTTSNGVLNNQDFGIAIIKYTGTLSGQASAGVDTSVNFLGPGHTSNSSSSGSINGFANCYKVATQTMTLTNSDDLVIVASNFNNETCAAYPTSSPTVYGLEGDGTTESPQIPFYFIAGYGATSSGTTPTLSIGENVGSDGSTQGAIAFLPPVTPATLTTVTGKASITGKAVIQ